ncbi:MAG TPA: PfkB family carbohydrate kinase [Armatimonadota bacterium]|nr:PfkB family carbohydrate kinase [Armatimonadota bacterium]
MIVGSMAIDSVRTPLGEVDEKVGGAAVYSSVAATFFSPVRLVGVIGDDFPPDYLQLLESRGVDLQGVQHAQGKTFRWKGYYDYDLNQAHSLSTELNVFETFSPDLPADYRNSKYVMLANIDPTLQLQVLEQARHPRLTLCDTMNYWISSKKDELLEVFRRVKVVIINDGEARQLCETFSLVTAADQIRALGPETVIIKKGEHGAICFHGDSVFVAPPFPLRRIVDPTGAGDTFAGGFIGYLSRSGDLSEPSIRRAVIYGSVLASFNIEDFGIDRMRNLTLPEIHARYRELRDVSFFEEMDESTF